MFRFTIRDLLWLMVVVALGILGWVNHRMRLVAENRIQALEYALAAEGWTATADGDKVQVVKPDTGVKYAFENGKVLRNP